MFTNVETEKNYTGRLTRYICAMRGGTPDRIPIPNTARPAGVCVPWEQESAAYTALSRDVELVRSKWTVVDADA